MSSEKAAPLIKRYVIQVNPGRPRLGIDLTLCPKSVVPDARNQRIKFTARIYAFKNGKWVYPGEKRKITFSFKEVSKERGVCMNYPIKDRNNETPASALESNTNPDLFFPDDDSMKEFNLDEDETDKKKPCPTKILRANDNPAHSHHYLKATTKKPVTEATVTVRCEDYGAFGLLQAIAPDCETIPPRENDAEPSEGIGPNDVKIPRDDNDNDIADSAFRHDKKRHGITASPDEDEDDTPHADDHKGDGLTNYEEYRGFIVKESNIKKHIRTNINKKDIFIYDRNYLGTGYFYKSGLRIHLIPHPDYYNGNSKDRGENELKQGDVLDPGTQVINFNRTSHSIQEQHGIRLVREYCNGLPGITWGALHPAHPVNAPRIPKDTNRAAIDRDKCDDPDWDPIRRECALPNTIAHELGHSVGLLHHGEDLKHEHTPPGETMVLTSDGFKGVTSGDVKCIMRYDNYRNLWCHDVTAGAVDGTCCIHDKPEPEAPGNIFCGSKRGTCCNDSRKNIRETPCVIRNDAADGRGNCKGRIRVKD